MPRKKSAASALPRLGRQTPTRSLVLPYTATRGQEAADLYAQTGRTAQQWQQLLLFDLLAAEPDGLWVHTKFGYSVPRRNGKNEVVAMREMWGLMQGEKILHTAHRTTTSHSAWERLCGLLDDAGIAYTSVRATGRERVRCGSVAITAQIRLYKPADYAIIVLPDFGKVLWNGCGAVVYFAPLAIMHKTA